MNQVPKLPKNLPELVWQTNQHGNLHENSTKPRRCNQQWNFMLSGTGNPLPDLPMVEGVHQSPMF
jgi:hypothetical protein